MSPEPNIPTRMLFLRFEGVLGLPWFLSLDKHVIRDGVPGIVNADKEQQQYCPGDE